MAVERNHARGKPASSYMSHDMDGRRVGVMKFMFKFLQ